MADLKYFLTTSVILLLVISILLVSIPQSVQDSSDQVSEISLEKHHKKHHKKIQEVQHNDTLNPEDFTQDTVLIWLHGAGGTPAKYNKIFDIALPKENRKFDLYQPVSTILKLKQTKKGFLHFWSRPIIKNKEWNDTDLMNSMKRIESFVTQFKQMGKKVFVGGTSQGGILSFAFAKRSQVSALVDGIICFNAIVTNETKEAKSIDMANKNWKIFTWAGTKDNKLNYAKVVKLYEKEFDQWGFDYTVRDVDETTTVYEREYALNSQWNVTTRASINYQQNKKHKDITHAGLHAMANWFQLTKK